jgi:aminopeptidase N
MQKNNRTHHIRLVLSVILVVAATLSVAAQRRERTIDSWKPLHYDVDLSFNDQVTELASAHTAVSLQVLAQNVSKIDLDFGDMPIDSVLVNGATAQFDRTPDTLNIALPRAAHRGDKLTVTINYHGHPKDGLVFAKDRDGNSSATGDNWPNRVHYWIPSLDHPSAKATVSFTVSAPQRYEVVANGRFITLTGNAATSHWKFEEAQPIPPYCMIVAVNQGAIINSPDKSVTNLLFNVPQRDREYALKGFSSAANAVAFFSQTIAPYPYEKLALIVGATRFGGMENSSAIVFTSTLFDSRANDKMSARFGIPTRIEDVVAHEIAHQWFGDSVTESTWADLWLSEGFATYFAGLFIEKYDGEVAFHDYMRSAAQRYFGYEQQKYTPIHDTTTVDLMGLLNPNNYEKGAWVLHMLRRQLGDDAFFRGLRDYYNAHQSANATSEDLRASLEKASGRDLKEFFARWVYGAGHPRYEMRWALSNNGKELTITVNQLQAGAAFLDPIPIEVTADGEKIKETINPKSKLATLTMKVNGMPSAVRIDPDDSILKEIVNE